MPPKRKAKPPQTQGSPEKKMKAASASATKVKQQQAVLGDSGRPVRSRVAPAKLRLSKTPGKQQSKSRTVKSRQMETKLVAVGRGATGAKGKGRQKRAGAASRPTESIVDVSPSFKTQAKAGAGTKRKAASGDIDICDEAYDLAAKTNSKKVTPMKPKPVGKKSKQARKVKASKTDILPLVKESVRPKKSILKVQMAEDDGDKTLPYGVKTKSKKAEIETQVPLTKKPKAARKVKASKAGVAIPVKPKRSSVLPPLNASPTTDPVVEEDADVPMTKPKKASTKLSKPKPVGKQVKPSRKVKASKAGVATPVKVRGRQKKAAALPPVTASPVAGHSASPAKAPAAVPAKKKKQSSAEIDIDLNVLANRAMHCNLTPRDFDDIVIVDLKRALKYNDRPTTGSRLELLKSLIDCMTNGSPPRCPECGGGRLRYGSQKKGGRSVYYCPGYYEDTDYISCGFAAASVQRVPWKQL